MGIAFKFSKKYINDEGNILHKSITLNHPNTHFGGKMHLILIDGSSVECPSLFMWGLSLPKGLIEGAVRVLPIK